MAIHYYNPSDFNGSFDFVTGLGHVTHVSGEGTVLYDNTKGPAYIKTKSGSTVKGWIKNCDTNEYKTFQFNPSPPFQYSRGATYATIESPGGQYPLTSFVKGNLRTFNLDLLLFDKPYTGKIDQDYMLFFGKLLTPETNNPNYTRPPKFILSYGYFTRTCVLEDLTISIEEYDRFLRPVRATISLAIRQEGA